MPVQYLLRAIGPFGHDPVDLPGCSESEERTRIGGREIAPVRADALPECGLPLAHDPDPRAESQAVTGIRGKPDADPVSCA